MLRRLKSSCQLSWVGNGYRFASIALFAASGFLPTAASASGSAMRTPASTDNASPSPLDDNQDPFQAHSNSPHQVQVLMQGSASLEQRLRMIHDAQSSLDLEYFEFKADHSGRLVLQALKDRIADKSRPIKIRMLVDGTSRTLPNGFTRSLANEIETLGISVKYFNDEKSIDFLKLNHRDHRKLIIADQKSFCGGGRNMSDEYLDLNSHYNRLDRDICVTGPLTSQVKKTFDAYWNSPLASTPKKEEISKSSQAVFQPTFEDFQLLNRVHEVGGMQLSNSTSVTVGSIDFYSDHPAVGADSRVMKDAVQQFAAGAHESLTVENFIYLPTDPMKKTLFQLANQGTKVNVLTNSPDSSIGGHVARLALSDEKAAAKAGIGLFLYSGKELNHQDYLSDDQDSTKIKWGLHTKTMVKDHKDFSVGSFNLDSRSSNINFEDQIIVHDSPILANAIETDIHGRMANSNQLDLNGQCAPGCDCMSSSRDPLTKTASSVLQLALKVSQSQL